MSCSLFADVNVGDELPELQLPPLSRHTLALYCGASGDHNPIHVDIDFARDVAGLDDVIGHGMLTMAYLGRLLTDWMPQSTLRSFSSRFVRPIQVGDRIICRGNIIEKSVSPEESLKVELLAVRDDGQTLVTGEATLS